MTYEQLIDKLFHINATRGMKLGLENVSKLHELSNLPTSFFKSIHVAGSNGKGSVATKVARGLELAGFKVGLYTSPHISSFCERIQINGKYISKEQVAKKLQKLFEICDKNNIPATFFEITTILAFIFFTEQKIDFAVVETGLGGRLDATNTLKPILTVITSISLEHTTILGDSLKKIATEKAGIIKDQATVIIGPNAQADVISKIAKKKNCKIILVKGDFEEYELENREIAKIALQYLKIENNIIDKAIKITPPCRFEIFKNKNKTIILDVAHNEDGIKKLLKRLKLNYKDKELNILVGFSHDKDIIRCLKIFNEEKDVILHLISNKHERITPIKSLKKIAIENNISFLNANESICDELKKTIKNNQIIVVCGSFFIMEDAKKFNAQFGFAKIN